MKNWKKFFGMLGALIFALGLNAMEFKSNPNVIAELEYFYAKDGTITGRRVNDSIQMYSYDKRGQLLAVIDGDGKPVEQYVYDPAGNILSKTVNGKTTTFTYDKANQPVSSTVDGKTTDYRYDGAGRLVQEGDKTYQYGYLDKILNVLENGETIAGFDYHMNGQIASVRRTATLPAQASADASGAGETIENFLWDGLALIHRGGTNYINEPAVTGGNPILADGNVLFNDMLGTTLGVKSGESFNQIVMTAFGETADKGAMFTGKPYVGEIGYIFLFRNYRADQGKWQSADPLGYPDGWNNLAYVNNRTINDTDSLGLCSYLNPATGQLEAYDWENPPAGVSDAQIIKCSSEEKWVADTLKDVPTGSATINCGSSHTFVFVNSTFDGVYKYIEHEHSYNCGKSCTSHLGHEEVYYTYNLNIEKKKIVYKCGHTEDMDNSPVKFVSLANIQAHIVKKIACCE